MRYVVGVDGGQTTTLAVVVSEDGEILGVARAGPANHIHEPGGPERRRRALTEAIDGALSDAGRSRQDIAAACCGMTGSTELVSDILRDVLGATTTRAERDVATALAGGTAGQPGIVVIAGTGSAAFGINAAGDRVEVGGWGYIMGDEGSGYDIGTRAMRAATNAADRSGPPTVLEQSIPGHFGLPDLWALHRKIYSGEYGRPEIAEIARAVGIAANAGDLVATRILADAAEDLAHQALAVLERLGALDDELSVVTAGGVFKTGLPFGEPFQRVVNQSAPRATVHLPLFPPIIGAALLALRDLGRPLDPALLDRLRADLPKVTVAK